MSCPKLQICYKPGERRLREYLVFKENNYSYVDAHIQSQGYNFELHNKFTEKFIYLGYFKLSWGRLLFILFTWNILYNKASKACY